MKNRKGAGGILTIILALIVIAALALYLINFVFNTNQPTTTLQIAQQKVTNPQQASQKTAEIGKSLQEVSTSIEEIGRKLG